MAARVSVALHVLHLAGETLIEPGTEFVEAICRCRGRDASEFKAEVVRVLFNANGKSDHGFILATSRADELA